MVAKSLAIIGVILALVGYLVLGTGSAVAVPSLTDETDTPTPTPEPTATPNGDEMHDPILLSGLVTLNGDAAPPGLAMRVLTEKDGVLCGDTVTQQGGRYEVLLGDNCPIGTDVTFRLEAVELDEHPESVTLSATAQDVTVAFEGLTATDLVDLGVLTELGAVEDAVDDVVAAAKVELAAPPHRASNCYPDHYRVGDFYYRRPSSSCRPGQIEAPGAQQRY